MDNRVVFLESTVLDVNSKIGGIEASRVFDSQTCDELKIKNNQLEKELQSEREKLNNLSHDFESLRSVTDDIDDLRSRSMRCNLLFHGIPEEKSPAARKLENCANVVLDYCKNVLDIPHAHENIKIERAHRISRYDPNKIRPVVVMFNHYPDKVLIKQKTQEMWKKYNDAVKPQSNNGTMSDGNNSTSTLPPKPIRVSDQFPKTVQERRKMLLPAMINAKKSGKLAYLSHDKLFIDNKMFTVDTVQSSGYNSI